MKSTNIELTKDIIYNLQAYFYWCDEYRTEEEWTALNKSRNFEERLRELLPKALEMLKDDDFDYRCG